jgi:hypothetical protein
MVKAVFISVMNIAHLRAIFRVRTTLTQEKKVTSSCFDLLSDLLLLFLKKFKAAIQGNEVPKTIFYPLLNFPQLNLNYYFDFIHMINLHRLA